MYGLPLRLAGRVSLLARAPVAATAKPLALPAAQSVRYAHQASSHRQPWDRRGSQGKRMPERRERQMVQKDERRRQKGSAAVLDVGRDGDEAWSSPRGRRERQAEAAEDEDDGPLFEPDPLEAEASVAGEHLAGSVSFTTLKPHVSDPTYQAITSRPLKLTTMSEVQAQVFALMPNLATPPPDIEPDAEAQESRKDLLIQAKTGTGKTLAFLVPAIEQRIRTLNAIGRQAAIDAGKPGDHGIAKLAMRSYARKYVGTVIVSPTRELATQIANEAMRVSANHPEFEVRLFVGGVSKGLQMRGWERGRRDIVVATTGRLLDLLTNMGGMKEGFKNTQLLVLDEADTLLDMGFRDDIEMLRNHLPPAPQRQTFLCSATLSREITQVARTLLRPDHTFIRVSAGDDSPVHAHVPQYHTVLPDATHQIQHLIRLIAHDQIANAGRSKVIIFVSTTKKTQLFATILRELAKTNLPASRSNIYELHSKKQQGARTNTSNMFRYDRSGASVLVTSDVSARGVDYPGVTRVIQLGVASSSEVYIHRVGRTGRAGTKGRGDLILLPWEAGFASHTLSKVPLKSLDVHELKTELETLAKDFESEPGRFIQRPPVTPVPRGHPRALGEPATYRPGVPERVDGLPDAVARLRERLDETAVQETFASMLGFYVGHTAELRLSKQDIVEGCKTWAVEAMGLPAPPYLSKMFLEKLGINDRADSGNFRRSSGRGGYGGGNRNSYGRPRFDRDGPSFDRDRRSFGDRTSFGGSRQSFGGGERQSFGGGERQSYGGGRPSFGGNRQSFGGGGRSFGGGNRQAYGAPSHHPSRWED